MKKTAVPDSVAPTANLSVKELPQDEQLYEEFSNLQLRFVGAVDLLNKRQEGIEAVVCECWTDMRAPVLFINDTVEAFNTFATNFYKFLRDVGDREALDESEGGAQ